MRSLWPCGDGFVFYASFELLLATIIYVSPMAINNQSTEKSNKKPLFFAARRVAERERAASALNY